MSIEKIHYGARVRSLPFVMSKFLSLGVSLADVIRMTTQTPAKLMHMATEAGSLSPGSRADVSIFKIEEREVMHFDTEKEGFCGKHLLIPQMTVVGGKIAFSQIDFSLPDTDIENVFAGKRI
jgi:predicted amidohydrolase